MPNRITTTWFGARIQRAADAALVAALAIASLVEIAFERPHGGGWCGPPAATVPLALLTSLPLLWRTTRPLAAYAAVNDVLPAIGWIGAAWLIGRIVHGRSHRAVELEALAHELDEQRELQARVAVVDERARIARELHDVVAHNVSMIVVQAGAAAGVLEGEQPHVREALAAIEVTGRETVDEMRRLLGVLRRADDGPALAPQPTLRELDALAAHVREAGLPVELRVEGAPRPLPPGVDVSAFRIVQEALTNALKHAGRPARARVTVRYQPGAIEVEIEDDGTGGGTGGGTGHGLIGMRERVVLYGGRLDAGCSGGGGYTVKARLPLGGAASYPSPARRRPSARSRGFRLILDAEADIEVVGEAGDGEEALEQALELRPDVVLMDIRMPKLNGIDATKRLLADSAGVRVLMLTTFDLDEYIVDAFRAGASGFLLKTAPRHQLVAGVRTVHEGDALLAPTSTRRLIEEFARAPAAAPMLDLLTGRELDVLRLLARGLTNAEIAAELVVEPSTVKSHVASLLSKLDLRDRVQAVVFAYENGLVRAGVT
jgi:DNA-binding NarL/FixJ family response regulator/signal transduction histidine kinase